MFLAATKHMLLPSVLAGLVSAGQPSFDCTKARTWSELQVCNDDTLANLDSEMATRFFDARAHAKDPARQQLVARQKAWLRERDECKKHTDPSGCLKALYTDRIAELSATTLGARQLSDPHAYCRAVIRSDVPLTDERYKGHSGNGSGI